MSSPINKLLACTLVVLVGLLAALPSLLPDSLQSGLPGWYRDHRITLGLDLRGGSHLLLQVETEELVDEALIQLAEQVAASLDAAGLSQGAIRVVEPGRVSIDLRRPAEYAAALDIARTLQRRDTPALFTLAGAGPSITLVATTTLEQSRLSDAVERSLEVVRRRLNESGVVEPLIVRQGQDAIVVQLPGVADPGAIKHLLGRTARLTFHRVDDGQATFGGSRFEALDASGQPYRLQQSPLLEGGHLTDARLGFDDLTGEPVVTFRLNAAGGERLAEITRRFVGERFAIVLDGEVITAPVIRDPILGGAGEISGQFTLADARDLALLLRAGSLPAPLSVIEERTVGPELGRDAIAMGLRTGLLGGVLVLAFMVLAYGRWGLLANLALLVNAGLTLGVLASLGATLTLPGIAGLILSVGMAVDANILINERIREESQRGASAAYAVRTGFRRAFGTILDANLTTLIAVSLLFLFGTGPVRGFAVTIAVGLAVSMFTSITLTRLMMTARAHRLGRRPLRIGHSFAGAGFRSAPIPFMKIGRRGLLVSVCLSGLSLMLLVQPGLNTGIDFRGGTQVEMALDPVVDIDGLHAALARANLAGADLQPFGGDGQYLVRLPAETATGPVDGRVDRLKTAVLELSPEARFPRVEVVGPSVSDQFLATSLAAVLFAALGMLAFLWIRYERHFAIAAMLTLGLDLSKTLGFFALFGIEFNLTAVAALLALIGYSVNDKVVVFDRIRENQRLAPDQPLAGLIDASLTGTLTRTLFTSATTFLALLPMGIAGGPAVASFALPMLFGIVVGTGSSIAIAAPLALWLHDAAHRAAERRRARGLIEEDSLFLHSDRP